VDGDLPGGHVRPDLDVQLPWHRIGALSVEQSLGVEQGPRAGHRHSQHHPGAQRVEVPACVAHRLDAGGQGVLAESVRAGDHPLVQPSAEVAEPIATLAR
jgi:hypothetical protein